MTAHNKPLVIVSLEDERGARCVDIRRQPDGTFDWAECRRDPEDGHGWRFTGYTVRGFDSAEAAEADARANFKWLG